MRTEHRHTSAYYKLLQVVPDEEDLSLHQHNCCPELITRRMHELIPLLRHTSCTVEHVGRDRAVVSVPLLDSTINQNGTQQAAIFYLLSDCTLAAGILGALPGVYITGIHDRCRALPIQFWTKHGSIQHLSPGTGTIKAVAEISLEDASKMRHQLIQRGRTECHEIVHIYQKEKLIATGEFVIGIYADMPVVPGTRVGLLQVQNIKLSALLIAGLRSDPISQSLAQEQGRAIAYRMSLSTPQLPALVQARSSHLEDHLDVEGAIYQQVVVMGVGLDTKPFRFAKEEQHWFGIDLPALLRERARLLSEIGIQTDYLTTIEADVRTEEWMSALRAAGYQEQLSTLFILEGVSMYFTETDLRQILERISALTSSNESVIWMDHITQSVLSLDLPEIKSFLASMTRLGEPFMLGFADANSVALPYWRVKSTTSSANVLDCYDTVFEEYRFSILEVFHY
jgi:methyltransferase (TIGR00027 family)